MLSKLSKLVKPCSSIGRQFAALSTAPQPQPNPNPDIKYTGVILQMNFTIKFLRKRITYYNLKFSHRFSLTMNGKNPLLEELFQQ